MYIIRKDEGSRSNVMITNTENNSEITEVTPIKRTKFYIK